MSGRDSGWSTIVVVGKEAFEHQPIKGCVTEETPVGFARQIGRAHDDES